MVNNQVAADAIDAEVNRLLAGFDFWEYCLYYDYDFFIKRPFLKTVAGALQYVYDEYVQGRSRRIAVSLPPRAGKSYITSLFCSWWLGKLPELCIMRNSCTATLYKKLSRHVRNFVKSDKFKAVFPNSKLARDNSGVESWSLESSRNGAYFGGGIDGTIIGSGANLAINDDLYKSLAHALNDNYNDSVIEWKESAADSRKERGCPEIFIGTRWRKEDVIGRAIESDKLDMNVVIAALDENGKSFCEDVKTTEEYQEIKHDIDPVIWEAEYMQNPIELKGLMFPKSQLHFYNPKTVDVNKMSLYRLGVIDPANEGGDDLSFPVGYLVQDKIYIHDVIYNSDGTDINEFACVNFIKNHNIKGIRFEGNSAWYLFGKNIRKHLQAAKSNCTLRIISNTENKHTRILAQAAFIRNNFIFREDWEALPEYKRFMKNLMSYMRTGESLHDDAPDSCAELAEYFQEQHRTLW